MIVNTRKSRYIRNLHEKIDFQHLAVAKRALSCISVVDRGTKVRSETGGFSCHLIYDDN